MSLSSFTSPFILKRHLIKLPLRISNSFSCIDTCGQLLRVILKYHMAVLFITGLTFYSFYSIRDV